MAAAESIETQRIKWIHDLLTKRLKNDGDGKVILTFKEIEEAPLLKSRLAFEHTLDFIHEQSGKKISYKEVKGSPQSVPRYDPSLYGTTRASEPVQPATILPPEPIGYEVFISDTAKLTEYFAEILKQKNSKKTSRPERKHFYSEVTVGELRACSDGLIRFKNAVIEMRPQLNTLCWLFMDEVDARVTSDAIKERIIVAKKRALTTNETIAKYVSELHKHLERVYGREVIFNDRDIGWRFEPERTT